MLNIKAKVDENNVKIELRFINDPEYDAILRLMESESEQGVIIVGHSFIEALIDQILIKRLIGINKPPSVGFCRKVKMCYSIGALTDIESRDLDKLNTIRNAFAHRRNELNFESEPISSISNSFEFFEIMNRSQITKSILPNRKKCECEIAYLLLSLRNKIEILPKIEKCPIPPGFNVPEASVTVPKKRRQGAADRPDRPPKE